MIEYPVDEDERVVLCDGGGRPTGTAAKASVHTRETALHLAFSCYLFDEQGRVLVTRRATTKTTWPAVRTNSCCGHPRPAESMTAAVRRRLSIELGVRPESVDLVLPQFAYRARMTNEIMENELCPVYRATVSTLELELAPDEVAEAWWQDWTDFVADVGRADDPLSPWCVEQITALTPLGDEPLRWPVADVALLPSAARP